MQARKTLLRVAGIHNREEVLRLAARGTKWAVNIRDIDRVNQTWSLRWRNQIGIARHRVGRPPLCDISTVQMATLETGLNESRCRILQIERNVETVGPSSNSGPVGKVVIVRAGGAVIRSRNTRDYRAQFVFVRVPVRA